MMEVVKQHNYLFHLDVCFLGRDPYFTLPFVCGNLPCGFDLELAEVSPSTTAAALKSDIVLPYTENFQQTHYLHIGTSFARAKRRNGIVLKLGSFYGRRA